MTYGIKKLFVFTLAIWQVMARANTPITPEILAGAPLVAIPCNSCTQQQYYTTAYNDVVANAQANGYTAVYDLINKGFIKYAVSRELGNNNTWIYLLEVTSPTSAEAAAWSQSVNAIQENSYSSMFFVNTTQKAAGFPYASDTTYDVVLTGAHQANISDWLMLPEEGTSLTVSNTILSLGNLISIPLSVVLKGNIFSVTVTIVMKDGGTLQFSWQGGQNEFTLISARDVNKNSIPITLAQVPGRYVFPNGGAGALQGYLSERFGDAIKSFGSVCTDGTLACSFGQTFYSCQWLSCGGEPQ